MNDGQTGMEHKVILQLALRCFGDFRTHCRDHFAFLQNHFTDGANAVAGIAVFCFCCFHSIYQLRKGWIFSERMWKRSWTRQSRR